MGAHGTVGPADAYDAAIGTDGHVYSIPHAQGERCAVRDLLVLHYGTEGGMGMLWNFTCFPCDDATAWEQAKALVRDQDDAAMAEYLRGQHSEPAP